MGHSRSRGRFFLSVPVENTLLLDLVHHHGSRDHVSETAILFIDRASDGADQIEAKRVDRPHEVAADALKHRDGPPARADHSDLGLALARSLAIPKNLEDRKIAPVKAKEQK